MSLPAKMRALADDLERYRALTDPEMRADMLSCVLVELQRDVVDVLAGETATALVAARRGR